MVGTVDLKAGRDYRATHTDVLERALKLAFSYDAFALRFSADTFCRDVVVP